VKFLSGPIALALLASLSLVMTFDSPLSPVMTSYDDIRFPPPVVSCLGLRGRDVVS
jgi:hypothetical protein